jgi:hypothetical protein
MINLRMLIILKNNYKFLKNQLKQNQDVNIQLIARHPRIQKDQILDQYHVLNLNQLKNKLINLCN